MLFFVYVDYRKNALQYPWGMAAICYGLEANPSRESEKCLNHWLSFRVWKMKWFKTCRLLFTNDLTITNELTSWFQKEVRLYVSLWENAPPSRLIYYLSKQFPNEFMVSLTSFKSSSIQHEIILEIMVLG